MRTHFVITLIIVILAGLMSASVAIGQPATEALQPGIPTGEAWAELSAEGGEAWFGDKGMALVRDEGELQQAVRAKIDVWEQERAEQHSPLGVAFELDVDSKAALSNMQLLLDYGQIPMRYGGDFEGRLTLYRLSNCVNGEPAILQDGSVAECAEWVDLPTERDLDAKRLIVDLTPLDLSSSDDDNPDSADDSANKLYLPLFGGSGDGSAIINEPGNGDGDLYVLSTAANGDTGDFGATPLTNVADYQVGLFSGSAQTSYPIPLPPGAAGPVPGVSFTYDSGSVDGMTQQKNNQPSQIGIGWDLSLGHIQRVFKVKSSGGGVFVPDHINYYLVLNGTSSLMVEDNGTWTLQNDPLWRIQKVQSTHTDHPDIEKTMWRVTTPDGTQYRFGGEFDPDSGADLNSAFYAPIKNYGGHSICPGNDHSADDDYGICDVVWKWNLDRIEDTNGNVATISYEQEDNWFTATRNLSAGEWLMKQMIRAGTPKHIEYTKRAGNAQVKPYARVQFNTELRCDDPTSISGCDTDADFPDTPNDLMCEADDDRYSCNKPNRATFWSQRRLSSVQTQVYENNFWRTVGFHDLEQSFPVIPHATYDRSKLWLDSITQRPGGAYSWSAFEQIEAEDFDLQSGIVITDAIDYGRGSYITDVDNNDYLMFPKVDFGSGASTLLARIATNQNAGYIRFRLDSTSGTVVATMNVTSTGGMEDWETREVTVSGASGIHDLYITFDGGTTGDFVNLNWFRFKPSSALPGLPPVEYEHTMLRNRRNGTLSNSSYMPRIEKIYPELGAEISFTYGQNYVCPTNPSNKIRMPYDCYPDSDGGIWNKWKVTSVAVSDSFSGNPTQTLTYGYPEPPTWGYDDEVYRDDGDYVWSDYRGHKRVTVTDGSGASTEYRFYRGMEGDRLNAGGGTYHEDITLSDSTTRTDENWLRGMVAEVRRLDDSDVELSKSVTEYEWTLTNSSGREGAYWVGTESSSSTIRGTTDKTTLSEYDYDVYGNVTEERHYGDTDTGDDDRTVQRGYVSPNTTDYIVDRLQWEKMSEGVQGSGGADVCTVYASTDVPVTIPSSGKPTVYSDLTIADSGSVTDVNVLDLNGTHTWVHDLSFYVISPDSTEVNVMYRPCPDSGSYEDFDVNFDDESSNAYSSLACSKTAPAGNGGTYQPKYALSGFDDEEMNGLWQMKVRDHYNNDGGSLVGWGLEICRPAPPSQLGDVLSYSEFAYDGPTIGAMPTAGNLTLVHSYSSVSPDSYSDTTMQYDSWGRPTVIEDANGNDTTTAYHATYGYVQSVTNALNYTVSTVADPGTGAPLTLTDANGHVTTYQYDSYGRAQKIWLPTEPTGGNPSYWFEYHPEARPAWVKSRQLQDISTGHYLEGWTYVDGLGRSLQSQSPSATMGQRILSSQQYDNVGRVRHSSSAYEISGTAGSGYVTPTWSALSNYHRSSYDELGNLVQDETLSSGSVLWSTSALFDAWRTVSTDANSHQTERFSDAFGQLRHVIEHNSGGDYDTYYDYDLAGNLKKVTDDASNVTTMSYDLLGRKTGMTDPDMGVWSYQYDDVGNLLAQQDGRSQWLYMDYDDLNRLTSKRKDSDNGPLVAEYFYDASGYLGLPDKSKAYTSQGVVEVRTPTYDARGRLLKQEWVVPGTGGGTFRMDYAYSEADQRTSLRYPGGNGGQQGELVSFSYNGVGQLQTVAGSGVSYLSQASYNALGQATELRLDQGGNGLTRKYDYNTGTLRLDVLKAGVSAPYEDIQKLNYSYDNVGNVQNITDARNSGQVQSFGYDWLDRLTSASTNAAGTGQYNHTYAYDSIGNITSYAGNAYTYGSSKPHAVTAAFGDAYAYDANGNQTSRTISSVTSTLSYDYENRLTGVSGGATATFLYDANGNRVKGTVSGTTTVYVAGLYEWQNGATTQYYEGPTGIVALRRAGHASDNGVKYMLGDHLGSTSMLVNQNGTLNSTNYYYPYGDNRGGSQSTLTTKRFTGQYHEAGIGLYYYNARWYDSRLARFTQADTIVPDPASSMSLNRYMYVAGNPLRYTDPSGHCIPQDFGDRGSCVPSPPGGGGGSGGGSGGGGGGGGGGGDGGTNPQELTRPPFPKTDAYWRSQQTGMELVHDWFYELGDSYRTYGPDALMTKYLMEDEGVQEAKEWFYQDVVNHREYPYRFDKIHQPIREEFQYWVSYSDKAGIGRVIGGYNVFFEPYTDHQGMRMVQISVPNVMGRTSGTRLLGRRPSLEGAFLHNEVGSMKPPRGIKDYIPRSILMDRTRAETAPDNLFPNASSGWGGNLTTIFIWHESVPTHLYPH